jgi:hypothetical protein
MVIRSIEIISCALVDPANNVVESRHAGLDPASGKNG